MAKDLTNNDIQTGGTCTECGGPIYQGILADWCDCGHSNQSY